MIGKINFDGGQSGYNDAYGTVGTNIPNGTGKLDEKEMSANEITQKKRAGEIECTTCESRQYVDGSDDPGVSFKTPTKISPEQSASKVMSHEMEHYNREAAKANKEDREVVSNRVSIFRSTCPECGRNYVSGGLTTTVTRKKQENEHFFEKSFDENIAVHFGKKMDTKV